MTPRQTVRRLVSDVFHSRSHRHIGDRALGVWTRVLTSHGIDGQSFPPKETENDV